MNCGCIGLSNAHLQKRYAGIRARWSAIRIYPLDCRPTASGQTPPTTILRIRPRHFELQDGRGRPQHCLVHRDAPLTRHFLEVSIANAVAGIPPPCPENDHILQVTTLEARHARALPHPELVAPPSSEACNRAFAGEVQALLALGSENGPLSKIGVDFRAPASVGDGGAVTTRLPAPTGRLAGLCSVQPATGRVDPGANDHGTAPISDHRHSKQFRYCLIPNWPSRPAPDHQFAPDPSYSAGTGSQAIHRRSATNPGCSREQAGASRRSVATRARCDDCRPNECDRVDGALGAWRPKRCGQAQAGLGPSERA